MKNLTLNQALAAHKAGRYDFSLYDNDTVLIICGEDRQYHYYTRQDSKYAYVMTYSKLIY